MPWLGTVLLAFAAGWLMAVGVHRAERARRRRDFCERCRENGAL